MLPVSAAELHVFDVPNISMTEKAVAAEPVRLDA
jgi:hypothetical protein